MTAFPRLHPAADRSSPLEAVVLTDAELDHTLGLLLLREADEIVIHATSTVRAALEGAGTVLSPLAARCSVIHHEVTPGIDTVLGGGLSYRAFDAPTTKLARPGTATGQDGQVVGYRITDHNCGQALVYLPGMQQLTPAVRNEMDHCACLLVDGTCWSDDELTRMGLGQKTATQMGHLPISGPRGSLEPLSSLDGTRVIYTHINNTNPVLLEDSEQRQIVDDHGLEVAADGMEVQL